jgi:hypothetical protein
MWVTKRALPWAIMFLSLWDEDAIRNLIER